MAALIEHVTSPNGPRPYRSHRFPACDACRKRKSRCIKDSQDETCLFCLLKGGVCASAGRTIDLSNIAARHGSINAGKRRHKPSSVRGRDPSALLAASSEYPDGTDALACQNIRPSNRSAHIVSPVTTRDARMLVQYLYSEQQNTYDVSQYDAQSGGEATGGGTAPSVTPPTSHRLRARPNPYNIYSNDLAKPVIYINVPRQRPGSLLRLAGKVEVEIFENMLGGFSNELIELYFTKVNSCFPVLNEVGFKKSRDKREHSLTILCEIYANALIFWNECPVLAPHPRPSLRYAWNQAVASLHEGFQAPGWDTLLAALLELTGRPIHSITGNATNMGRVVALAHSLGLNRNPNGWSIPAREKDERVAAWWAVVVHDCWSSFAHGTPPHLNRLYNDVPVPLLDMVISRTHFSEDVEAKANCFVSLCQLTLILWEALPLVYELKDRKGSSALPAIEKLGTLIDNWEKGLPTALQLSGHGHDRAVEGGLSLQLCYLAVRMLLNRLALHETAQQSGGTNGTAHDYYQDLSRMSAGEVVLLVVNLRHEDLFGFWLPYSAYHFASALTLLLRCTLETKNKLDRDQCMAQAETLLSRLRHFKEQYEWDLGDICLVQCEPVTARLKESFAAKDAAASSNDSSIAEPFPSQAHQMDVGFANFEELDDLFPDLWDMFAVSTNGFL